LDPGKARFTHSGDVVLKKAGIVVAASAAALLALGPLAYAGSSPDQEDRGEDSEQVVDPGDEGPQEGLINLGDVNLLNGVNVCPDVTAALGLGNVLGILGTGTGTATATDAPTNCENSATAGG
jgi:hypothetical protein